MALKVHGPIDGLLIWTARKVQKRSHRLAWPIWELSNRYENWRFWRMWDRIQRDVEKRRAE